MSVSTYVSTSGNETFNAGSSADAVIYSGNSGGYNLRLVNGALVVMDTNPANGNDGIDLLYGIRNISFADGTVHAAMGGEFRVNSDISSTHVSPSLTKLVGGGFVVTWQSDGQDGNVAGVYGQRYDALGNTVGSEFQINVTSAGFQGVPSVSALADGGFVVTWEASQDGSYMGIYGRRYHALGNATTDEFQINTYYSGMQNAASVTGLADGGFVVTWQSDGQDGLGGGIYGQRYDVLGVPAGSEFLVNSYTLAHQAVPSVTALVNGSFVVTWESSHDSYGVYGQLYDGLGNTIGSEFRVNSYTADVQGNPSVTALADGGFVVTWESNNQDGSGYGIYGQRYGSLGNTVGSEFRVSSYSPGFQDSPNVTALVDGGFVVTWQSNLQDGSGSGVYGQRYDAQGNRSGSEFQVNSHTDRTQSAPSVTALEDGGFVVTWVSYVNGQYEIYGQRFSADGAKVDLVLQGDSADNTLTWSGAGNLVLDGLEGNDRLTAGAGQDELLGGDGNDLLNGAGGADYLNGGEGDDVLSGGVGADHMIGGNGDDTYFVNTGSDVVVETAALYSGIDTVKSSIGYILGDNVENLTLTGTRISIGIGNILDNVITGNVASNVIEGYEGNDTLSGAAGNDQIYGSIGDDELHGGAGKDTLTGGTGNDSFVFDTAAGNINADTINDFWQPEDQLVFSSKIFTQIGLAGDFDAGDGRFYAAADAVHGHDADDRIIYNTTTGRLYYDANGSAAGGSVLVARLWDVTFLDASDISVA